MVFSMNLISKISAALLIVGFIFSFQSCKKDDNVIHVDFESLKLPADTFWNGSDNSGGFTVGSATFANSYNSTYKSWEGFAYSSKHDYLTAGYGNMYSCYAANETNMKNTFALAYQGMSAVKIDFNKLVTNVKFKVTNSTYAYISMLKGDSYSKKFGGTSGNDQDWFLLKVTALNAENTPIGTADIYLADFRFSDNTKDYITNAWSPIDLSSLGEIKSLKFELSSSDNGTWGMNTPAFFCLDNLEYVEK